MIRIGNVSGRWRNMAIDHLTIEVADGRIQALLSADWMMLKLLVELVAGVVPPSAGSIELDGHSASPQSVQNSVACLDRIYDAAEYDADIQVEHWLAFIRTLLSVPEDRLLEMLIKLGFSSENRRKRLKYLDTEQFRLLYAAVQCARPCRNWLIHDFHRGMGKEFEQKINRIWRQKREQGESVLYLTNDLFYAVEIADRIGFIKHGQLLFETSVEEIREMDFPKLHRQFLG